ncbi:MAG: lysylphosphatidylglycerol synthase transmembrane domain-containing protein [Acidimicrobiales bacterium]
MSRLRVLGRVLFLLIMAVAFYGLAPQLLDMWDQVPNLRTVSIYWFVAVLLFEVGSYACAWKLTRVALPQVSWFVAATAQLASNAVAKVVPGGAAIGAATGYRMLSVSGIDRGAAGAALTATSIISNGVLLCLPMVALVLSVLGAPIPGGMIHVAWGGAVLAVALFGFAFSLVRFERPILLFARVITTIAVWINHRRGKTGGPTVEGIIRQRDDMVSSLGARWHAALLAAVGNWLLDYFALVCALKAVGVDPRLSLVLLAYAVAAVLGMIPITPGGVGFVEAGLTAMLVLAGVPGDEALLAVLAYRIASYWLPLPAGLGAHFVFRHRYGHASEGQSA